MLFGNHEARPSPARRSGAFRPRGEGLETRALMAVIDLGGTSPPNLPAIATAPYGIALSGGNTTEGDGYSVADVGDLLGTGFDDFVIGGPAVQNLNGVPSLGTGTSTVYLVFGSRTATGPAISDWLANTSEQRVGDLTQLGTTPQTNPIDGNTGFPFDGVKFTTSLNPNSQLGASVAQAGIINGVRSFLIGAPGALDDGSTTADNGTPSNPGTGRAYLIYGGTALDALGGQTVDLDTTSTYGSANIVTFETNDARSQVGYSVAGVGDVITDGVNNEIAIGAPLSGLSGQGSSGTVYLLNATGIPASTATVKLQTVGQSGGVAGSLLFGAAAGDEAGWSVSPAFDVNGAITSTNFNIDDFLIGAPHANGGTGAAYLIYGSPTFTSLATTVNGLNAISLANVGTTTVPGTIFQGANSGDDTGWSVSSAGDFNGDGLADIIIGSPGIDNTQTGRADIVYGQGVSGTPLTGTVTLGSLPTNFTNATLIGSAAGDLAGFSVGYTGIIRSDEPNPVLIGAPGYNLTSGTAYVIPGNLNLVGSFNLRNANAQPVAATQLTLTTPGVTQAAFFGASVGGTQVLSGQTDTADGDLIADFIIGAPGYSATTGRLFGGGAFIEEGKFIPLQTPTAVGVTSPIFIDQPNVSPFNISATSPTTLKIYVDSAVVSGKTFDPVLDLDPKTIIVNGVAFPNATVVKDPVDENNDGIEDAIVTVQPRSAIGLTNATTSITLRDTLLASSPFPGQLYSSRATGTVTGGSSGGGGGGGTGGGGTGSVSGLPIGRIVETAFIPHFGPTQYVPTLAELSADSTYKPIPLKVAIQQYLPQPGFGQRIYNYYYPTKKKAHQPGASRYSNKSGRTNTLGSDVFTRSEYKKGKPITFTHKQKVVPTNLQTERVGYYTK